MVLALPRDVEDQLCSLASAIVQRTSTLGTFTVLGEGRWVLAGFATISADYLFLNIGACRVSVKVTDVKVYDTDAIHVTAAYGDPTIAERCTILVKKKKISVQSTLATDGSYPRAVNIPMLIQILQDLKDQIEFTFRQ